MRGSMAATTTIAGLVAPSRRAQLAGAPVRLEAVPDLHLPAAGGRPAAHLPDLSARPRHLARLHRHHHRQKRPMGRGRELRVPDRRQAVLAGGVLQRVLHVRRHGRKVRARALARAAAQQPSPLQDHPARHHPAAVDHADGPLGHRLLVDLRSAVLHHLLRLRRRARACATSISTSSAPPGRRAGR